MERFADIGVPKTLSEFGLFSGDLRNIVRIMSTQQAAFDQKPVSFSVKPDFADFIHKYLE